MTYDELLLHNQECLKKKIQCPLACGQEVESEVNGLAHYFNEQDCVYELGPRKS